MTYAAGQAERNESPILHAAIALAPAIRALGDEIEQGRRIPASVVHAMQDAGIFGMPMPRAWGGPELDPLTQFRVLEALAMADGSVRSMSYGIDAANWMRLCLIADGEVITGNY